jgi:hypothetical protein
VNAPRQSRLAWYARRLGRMSAGELAWRCRDAILQTAWSARQAKTEPPETGEPARPGQRQFTARLPARTASLVPEVARSAVLTAARRHQDGHDRA